MQARGLTCNAVCALSAVSRALMAKFSVESYDVRGACAHSGTHVALCVTRHE